MLGVATLLFAGVAYSATTTYTWTSGTTATSTGIANAAGVAYQNSANVAFAGPGIISWGYFNISDAAITAATSASTLVSNFVNWNTAPVQGTFAAPGPGATSNRGTFNFNAAARDLQPGGTGEDFATKNMYVFVGSGTTFAGSSEFLVLKTNFTFDAGESGPTAFVKTMTSANSSVLFGTTTTNVFTTGADASQNAGFRTAPVVPEPSAALLGALGALGLLRRRRN